jgi:hypothetical protein
MGGGMILIEAVLWAYAKLVLGVTGAIQIATGLYPREQLNLVQNAYGIPESAGVLETVAGVLS